jgi:DNA-binding transcriptional MerR regulator
MVDDAHRGFYAGDAARITGIPYRTIDHWARTGLITPSISEGRGAGRSRLYNLKDLIALRVARDLRDRGISIQSLRKVVKKLRSTGLNLAGAQLLVIGKDIAIINDAREIESVLSVPGQLYLTPGTIFDLRKPIADIHRNVARLHVA